MNILISLILVAFLTLLERKVLSYSQSRKGPNKVRFLGLLQPLLDGMKLGFKSIHFQIYHSSFLKSFAVCFGFGVFLVFICKLPSLVKGKLVFLFILLFLVLISLLSYLIFFIGKSVNSKFKNLGSFRSLFVSISFESKFLTLSLFFFYFIGLKYFSRVKFSKSTLSFILLAIGVFLSLIELNRSPFDFLEGESELVSGFKTEYYSLNFALLSLVEYGMIFVFRVFWSYLFFRGFLILVSILGFLVFFILVRATFPRLRLSTTINTL